MDTNTSFAKSTPFIRLERYSGETERKASDYLNFLELYLEETWTDREKIRELGKYLEKQALDFFMQEITKDINTLTWDSVKKQMIDRFDGIQIDPIIEVTRTYLKRGDTINQYYKTKVYHMNRAKLPEATQVTYLTMGLPADWKPLFAYPVHTTTREWLVHALNLEESFRNKDKGKQAASRQTKDRESKRAIANQASARSSKPPPYPCMTCKNLGKPEELHWHSDCPNKKNRQKRDKFQTDTDDQTTESLESQI